MPSEKDVDAGCHAGARGLVLSTGAQAGGWQGGRGQRPAAGAAGWRAPSPPLTAAPLTPACTCLHISPSPGALPGALDRDGGGTFEGPEAASESVPTPQLASCFWFVSVEGPAAPLGAASVASAGSAASSAPGAPATPMGSREGGGATAAAAVPVQPYASRAVPAELEGLEMGPLVGSGSFGRGELLAGGAGGVQML